MKIKTSELTGAALDWAVAECEGNPVRKQWSGFLFLMDGERQIAEWKPSLAWAQGGPIIEREGVSIGKADQWWAFRDANDDDGVSGPTPLVAAMRCYVESKLGDEVEVPEGLV